MRQTLILALLFSLFSVHSMSQRTNWVDVAHWLGGSGKSVDGKYVRLFPSRAWGESKTPPIWIEFDSTDKRGIIKGLIFLIV